MNKTPSTFIENIIDGTTPYEIEVVYLPLRNTGNVAKLLLEFKSVFEQKE